MKRWIILTGFVLIVVAVAGGFFAARDTTDDRPVANASDQKRYVALGDSIASGVGIGEYTDASACNRTDASYPSIVARDSDYRLVSHACSAATIPEGIDGEQDVNHLATKPQLEALRAEGKPDLITLTIGANDIKWTRFVRCYSGTCGDKAERQEFEQRLNEYETELDNVLSEIDSMYDGSAPRTIVTGYYDVFPTELPDDCDEAEGLDQTELDWVREVFSSLNDTIESVTERHRFASFAPIDFSGHALCSDDSWIQTADDKSPYHPNEAGQAAMARAVMNTLKRTKEGAG